MQNLLNDLTELLSTDDRLVSQGRLLKNKVSELALKMDSGLIKHLLKSAPIKKHFFTEIDGILVFDKIKFQKFVSNKEFLPDSYTAFKNKIGLVNESDEYLSESKEVVLAWPYKDCVLEGGQTKEDQKRNEIFWNETLAPDEIDRLLALKVFTNFKKYDKDGEHELKGKEDIDFAKENLIIKGNNLLALHSLYKLFAGKVKLINIDPPYNRDEDKTTFYNDNFNHSTWLTFMKNRLEISKKLLKPDGVLFISIDDNEQAYLKVLCDIIFGRENFLANIAYERSGVSGLGQGGDFVVNTHESILCYAKNRSDFSACDLSGEGDFGYEEMKRYNKILKKVGAGKEISRFTAPATNEEVVILKHQDFEIETISLRNFENREAEIKEIYLKNFDNTFRNTSIQEENEFQNKILSFCKDGFYSAKYLVSRGKHKGKWITAYYFNGQVFVWLKDSATISDGKIVKTNKLSDFWDHASIPKADLANEGGVKLRRGKKPENLMKRLFKMTTASSDIVLDFFTGSGTTCAVAHKMGRQYIGIEQLNYEKNDSAIRLQNVIKGDQSGISKSINWQGGGSFIYCELMQHNEAYIYRIKKANTTKDLLTIWDEMQQKAFISYKVEPKTINENISDFEKLSLDEQKQFLIEILDKNQLYVNYSEIDDKEYSVSEPDKKLNRKFYGEA